MTEENKDIIACFRYLEEHGGRLHTEQSKTKWPDGTEAVGWIYSAGQRQLFGKTLLDTIKLHRDV